MNGYQFAKDRSRLVQQPTRTTTADKDRRCSSPQVAHSCHARQARHPTQPAAVAAAEAVDFAAAERRLGQLRRPTAVASERPVAAADGPPVAPVGAQTRATGLVGRQTMDRCLLWPTTPLQLDLSRLGLPC